MGATVRDIARAAGVGRTTVLRALWDRDRISPETKARIKEIAAEMKYRPNFIARSLVSGQSTVVGVMATPSILAASYRTIELIETSLREAGYSMMLSTTGGTPGGERSSLQQLMQVCVAGLIAIPSSNSAEPEVYQELVDEGAKMVVLDRCVEGVSAPQIIGDDYRAGRLATEHLIGLGHKRIVHLAIPQTSYAGRERARGFKDAMRQAGLRVTSSSIIETPFGEEQGASVMAQLLKLKDRPSAVLARHDIVAVGAMRAICAAGLSIPEDISLVGNGDIWCGDVLTAPLTTIYYPTELMTGLAVETLLDMLAGVSVRPKTTVLGVDLVVRSSSAPPRSSPTGKTRRKLRCPSPSKVSRQMH